MDQTHIDGLLERYLSLLDEYTQLRENLSQTQSGVYQNIARANFSGERGMRYGQDHYDERMQASRVVSINVDDGHVPTFTIVDAKKEEESQEASESTQILADDSRKRDASEAVGEEASKTRTKVKNPLHWFGLFAPMPLRTAQTQSIQAVEQIVPRLVSVNAQMLELEIEVRRARKRRTKSEAAIKKSQEVTIIEA